MLKIVTVKLRQPKGKELLTRVYGIFPILTHCRIGEK